MSFWDTFLWLGEQFLVHMGGGKLGDDSGTGRDGELYKIPINLPFRTQYLPPILISLFVSRKIPNSIT